MTSVLPLVRVVKFNKARLLPDAFRQKVVDGFSTDMYTAPEIGFRYVLVHFDCLDVLFYKELL